MLGRESPIPGTRKTQPVGNLQGLRTEVLTSHRGVWVQLGAVCWQPTGPKDGSLDVTRGVWVQLGAVCWQPTGLKDGSLDVT